MGRDKCAIVVGAFRVDHDVVALLSGLLDVAGQSVAFGITIKDDTNGLGQAPLLCPSLQVTVRVSFDQRDGFSELRDLGCENDGSSGFTNTAFG